MDKSLEQLWFQTSPHRKVDVKIVKEVGKLSVYIQGEKELYLVGQEGAWSAYSARTLQPVEGQWRCHREAVLGIMWMWYELHLLQCKQNRPASACLELILDRSVDARTRLCASMSMFKSIAEKRMPSEMFPAYIKSVVLICSQDPEALTWLKYHALIQYYHDAREDIAQCWFRLVGLCGYMQDEIDVRGRVQPSTHQALREALIKAASRAPAW